MEKALLPAAISLNTEDQIPTAPRSNSLRKFYQNVISPAVVKIIATIILLARLFPGGGK